jgi:6-pyruvoyltetrahydropterin/6-carboxytetrahydropterin synthase
MVMDYKDLKTVVKENVVDLFDHSLVLSNKYNPESIENLKKEFEKVIVVDYQPTNENLIVDIASRIMAKLPESVSLHYLKLRETATAFAEWYRDDN